MFLCPLVKTGSKSAVRVGSSAPLIMETSSDDDESPLQNLLYLGRHCRRTDRPMEIIFGWCRANGVSVAIKENWNALDWTLKYVRFGPQCAKLLKNIAIFN